LSTQSTNHTLSACSLPASPANIASGKIVKVDLPASDRGYDIVVGESILSEAGSMIHLRLGLRRCVVVTDSNVADIYLKRLEAILAASGLSLLPSIIVPAGEASKGMDSLQTMLNQLFERGADRQTVVIALGGGMIGDLAGLAASLFMRGLDLVQIPTSLLAQVDSSVGGKTGVNSSYGKNTIGTFYQPRLVLSDASTLDSLPVRQMRAGYAEVLKYGIICDAGFFEWCRKHGETLLRGDREAQIYAVSKSCEHKARIVAMDERETGDRALLNFGHTFAHAFETATGYGNRLLHGEAVAIGMLLAMRLSAGLGICPPDDAALVEGHLRETGLPVSPPAFDYDIDMLMELMGHDKKTKNGKFTFVLARGIGHAFVSREINPSPVRSLLQGIIGGNGIV